jgi:hypothetical protein
MKIRKNNIGNTIGVVVSIMVIASSFIFCEPVEASAPGDVQWTQQDIPTTTNNVILNGSQIIDIAVGSDAKTIYVIEPIAVNYIMKSTDAGQSFDAVVNNFVNGAGAGAPVAISVAPDDVNTVAVTDGINVIITKDGGTTWSALPAPLSTLVNGTAIYARSKITDIAVAPARSGTLLGREYVISLVDPAAGTAGGDVLIIGNNAIWTTVGKMTPATTDIVTGQFDFTSVVVTPNFLGDRCVVAVGTKAAPGSTALVIINTATNTVVVGGGANVTGTLLNPAPTGTTTDYANTTNGVATSIVSSRPSQPTSTRRPQPGGVSMSALPARVPLIRLITMSIASMIPVPRPSGR